MMKKLVLLTMFAVVLAGCRTHGTVEATATTTTTSQKVESVTQKVREVRDSVIFRDSVRFRQITCNDTIYIVSERVRWVEAVCTAADSTAHRTDSVSKQDATKTVTYTPRGDGFDKMFVYALVLAIFIIIIIQKIR